MRLLKYFSIFLMISACSQNNSINIEDIFDITNVEQVLRSKSIEFIKEDINSVPNYSIGLYGEKIDSTITNNYRIHYKIDWKKEKAFPNMFFKEIPFREPNILTNKNGKPIIVTANIGNGKSFDIRDLGVFDNNQVMVLKETLTSAYGKPSLDKPEENNSIWSTNLGNTYVWEHNNFIFRLSIYNECFCKKAEIYNLNEYKEHPKGGRYGQLVIYNNIKPKLYLDD